MFARKARIERLSRDRDFGRVEALVRLSDTTATRLGRLVFVSIPARDQARDGTPLRRRIYSEAWRVAEILESQAVAQ